MSLLTRGVAGPAGRSLDVSTRKGRRVGGRLMSLSDLAYLYRARCVRVMSWFKICLPSLVLQSVWHCCLRRKWQVQV